jgi:hypothetical protein
MTAGANCNATNTAGLAVASSGPLKDRRVLLVNCKLKVDITDPKSHATFATYTSDHVGVFAIYPESKATDPDVNLDSVTLASCMSAVNHFSVRNAEGYLALTGIASVRIAVPVVSPISVESLLLAEGHGPKPPSAKGKRANPKRRAR